MKLPISLLTDRQKRIGLGLLSGMSIQEIADQLKVSMNTVRDHQRVIKRKFSCKNAYQAGYHLGSFFKNEEKIYSETLKSDGKPPHF